MKTIRGVENFPKNEASIVTIGTFDGVHLGHQQILRQLIATSQKGGIKKRVAHFLSPSTHGAATRYFYAFDSNH